MEEKFKYGIFDLDGTIVNSIPTYAETFCEMLEEKFGISEKDSKDSLYYLNSTGTPLDEQFAHVLESKDKPKDKIPEMVKEFFKIVNKKDFVLFDGAKKMISGLDRQGMTLFLTTGSEDEATKKRLERAGILKYFSLVLGSSRKEKGPWHIEKFARTVKVPINVFSEHAFYVGDGPYDMQIAKIFGIHAIGIATTVSGKLLLEFGANEVVGGISDIGKLKIFG